MRHAVAVLCAALLSCERSGPPEVPVPAPPPAVVLPPAAPRAARSSFEGTWLTDQGALVIHRDENWYRGSFLPLKYPGVHFFSRVDNTSLDFQTFDGYARWKGSFLLIRDGY